MNEVLTVVVDEVIYLSLHVVYTSMLRREHTLDMMMPFNGKRKQRMLGIILIFGLFFSIRHSCH